MAQHCLLALVFACGLFGQGLAAMAAIAGSTASKHQKGAASGTGRSSQRSIAQIVETLHNLRKSLEDQSREADSLSSASTSRCTAALHFLDGEASAVAVNLGHLRADLQEQQAAVEEVEGTAQQVRTDMAMVQRTLNRTEEMLQVASLAGQKDSQLNATDVVAFTQANVRILKAMSENKWQTLISLRGELEVLMPEIAQMQARAMETKRRLADRADSASSAARLMVAVKEDCAKGSKRNNVRATARAKEQGSIDAALQATHQIWVASQQATAKVAARFGSSVSGGLVEERPSEATEDPLKDAEMAVDSFVQVLRSQQHGRAQQQRRGSDDDDEQGSGAEDTAGTEDRADGDSGDSSNSEDSSNDQADAGASEEDLESIFGAPGADAEPTHAADAAEAEHMESAAASAPLRTQGDLRPQKASVLKPRIQQMLERLESERHSQGGTQTWCEQEQAHSRLSERIAKANADELGAQAEAHAQAQAELKEEVDQISSAALEVNATAREFERGAAKEKQHIATSAKDQVLATRILTQAIAILNDLRKDEGPDGPGKTAEVAVKALTSAKSLLDAQANAAQHMLFEVTKSAHAVAKGAAQTAAALKRENASVAFTRDAHGSEYARSLEDKRMYDAERGDVEQYSRNLARECNMGVDKAQEREENVEIRALKDAKNVLDGGNLEQAPASDDDGTVEDSTNNPGLRGAVAAVGAVASLSSNLSPLERAAAAMGVDVEGN